MILGRAGADREPGARAAGLRWMANSKKTDPAPKAVPPILKKKIPGQTPLVTSRAQAEREKKALRRGRNELEAEPRVGETDIRTSI